VSMASARPVDTDFVNVVPRPGANAGRPGQTPAARANKEERMSLTLRGRAAAAAQGSPPDPTDAQKQFTDAVIGYIPAETLAMTIALFSVVSSRDGRWAILVGGLVVTPIWLLYNYAKTVKRRPRVANWPWVPILEATIAYPAGMVLHPVRQPDREHGQRPQDTRGDRCRVGGARRVACGRQEARLDAALGVSRECRHTAPSPRCISATTRSRSSAIGGTRPSGSKPGS
jgi:hypothetical protein